MSVRRTPDPDTVLNTLIDITARMLGLEPADISPDDLFGDLDVDSVLAVEMVAELGDSLGDVVDPRDLLVDWSGLSMRQLATDLSETLTRRAGLGPGTPAGGGA